MTDSDNTKVIKLKEGNYPTWAGEVSAYLRTEHVWRIVTGEEEAPSKALRTEYLAWLDKSDLAAGTIFLSLDDSQKVHVRGIEDDPISMWKALKEVHMQQKPTARFNAYEALFNITKSNDESLPAVAARVEKAMHTIKDLRPSEFTLNELDDDLACMALIRSLPPDQYASFRSSLLLLPSISMSVLKDALQAEESNRQPSAAAAAAVVATSKKQRPKCTFCDKLGHSIDKCYAYRDASRDAKDKGKQPKSAPDSANVAQAASNACTFNTGPSLSDASSDWNTDTGATSHMTPHRH